MKIIRLFYLHRHAYYIGSTKLRLQYLDGRVYILRKHHGLNRHSACFNYCLVLVHYFAALRSVTKFCCAFVIFCRSRSAFTACWARVAVVCRLATFCCSGVFGLIGWIDWISCRRIGYLASTQKQKSPPYSGGLFLRSNLIRTCSQPPLEHCIRYRQRYNCKFLYTCFRCQILSMN